MGEAALSSIVDGIFDGCRPRAHICSDLAYMRVGGYACLLIDLYSREIVRHAADERKDAQLG